MTGLFPIGFLGSVAYFQEILKYDTVVFEVMEHFPKQTYRNRCDINTDKGITSLSIPVEKPNGNKTLTKDILPADHDDWQRKHWRAIESAYKSAPFFEHYAYDLEPLFLKKGLTLVEYNVQFIDYLKEALDLPLNYTLSTEFTVNSPNDYRESILSKHNYQNFETAPYQQVFPGEEHYKPSLSILDLLFCEGPMARKLLITDKH